jgi:hypothetical protein
MTVLLKEIKLFTIPDYALAFQQLNIRAVEISNESSYLYYRRPAGHGPQ